MLTVREAAERLRVSTKQVRRMLIAGLLPGVKLPSPSHGCAVKNSRWLIRGEGVDALLTPPKVSRKSRRSRLAYESAMHRLGLGDRL